VWPLALWSRAVDLSEQERQCAHGRSRAPADENAGLQDDAAGRAILDRDLLFLKNTKTLIPLLSCR
jgi:hypothetical protein